jgi:hypothetical protein
MSTLDWRYRMSNRSAPRPTGVGVVCWIAIAALCCATAGPVPAGPSQILPTDSDSDGLPDAWERAHFRGLGQDAESDADGDGASNGFELKQGTSPVARRRKPPVPGGGLVLWLDAGRGVSTDPQSVLMTWEDQSGHENHAFQPNPACQPAASVPFAGSAVALGFDGVDDHLAVPDSPTLDPGLGDFAVVCVMQPTIVAHHGHPIAKAGSWANFGFNVSVEPGSGKLRPMLHNFWDGAFTMPASPALTDGTPRVTVVNWQRSGVVQGFVSGLPVGEYSIQHLANVPIQTDAPLLIGRHPAGDPYLGDFPQAFSGKLAHVLVYHRTLSAQEIATLEDYFVSQWSAKGRRKKK